MNYMTIVEIVTLVCALVGNCFAMEGAVKGCIKLRNYRRFLISLLASGIYICAIRAISLARTIASDFADIDFRINKCAHKIEHNLEMTGFIAYLLNLCGMFLDHFLGIVYPHKYQQLMNTLLVRSAVFLIWIGMILLAFLDYGIVYLVSQNTTKEQSIDSTFNLPIEFRNCDVTAFEITGVHVTTTKAQGNCGVLYVDLNNAQALHGVLNSVMSDEPVEEQVCKMNVTSELLLDIYIGTLLTVGETAKNKWTWCCFFEGTEIFEYSLDYLVMALTVFAIVFMGICQVAFKKVVSHVTGLTRRRLSKLNMTTLLLLGVFSISWVPFATHEIAMAYLVKRARQENGTVKDEAENSPHLKEFESNSLILHNILYTLFLLSPLVIPVIYVARIGAVHRYLAKRYGCEFFLRLLKDRERQEPTHTESPVTTQAHIRREALLQTDSGALMQDPVYV